MRKRFIISLITVFTCVFCFVQSSFTLTGYAEGETISVKFGESEVLNLKLIEDFEESTLGSPSFGSITLEDGSLKLSGSALFDIYGISLPMLDADPSLLSGVKYLIFDFINNSDGDVYFCFQPAVNGSNVFLSGTMTETISIIDNNGKLIPCLKSDSPSVNARYGFEIPYEASGYILVPVSLITNINIWDTPVFTGDPSFTGVGFHVAPIDSSYLEFFVGDMYGCGDLPAYVEPPEPTPSPSPVPTPTMDPSAQATPTLQPTNAPSPSKDPGSVDSDSSSSSGINKTLLIILISVGAVVVAGVVVLLIVMKKKK